MGCCNCNDYHEFPLDWFLEQVKIALKEWDVMKHTWEETKAHIKTYLDRIDNFFENLDLTAEVDKKLEEMRDDGTFNVIIRDVLKRRYIFVGDSYILGYSQDGKIYKSYAQYIKEGLNLQSTTLGASGAGFANAGSGPNEGKTFLDCLKLYSGNDNNYITDIYVLGGYNDRTKTQTEIYLAMEEFRDYVRITFPNAKITVGFIGWSMFPAEYASISLTCEAYTRCGTYDMAYIENSQYILHNTKFFTTDFIHPNNEGHIALASYLSSYINGNSIDVVQPRAQVAVPMVNNVQLGPMFTTLDNGVVTITMPDFCNINLSAYSGNYWGQYWINISDKLNPTPILGYQETYWSGAVLWEPLTENKFYTAPASIKMVDGKFFIQIQAINSEGNALYNGQIRQVIIPSFMIVSPSMLS